MNVAQPLWTRTVRLSEVARSTEAEPSTHLLSADGETRAAIATALGLVRLDRLDAELDLSGWFDGVRIDARWRADIVQICGISLDEFETRLCGEFTVRAVPPDSRHAAPAPDTLEVDIDIEADDPPDTLETDLVDLGAYVVEHLSLEIDPFPRKPGAVFDPPTAEPEHSPFAALLKLKTTDPDA